MSDVLVFAEHLQGNLTDSTFELLGKGRELAQTTGGHLIAALLGKGVEPLTEQMGVAHKVVMVEHQQLAAFNPEAYAIALKAVVQSLNPSIILIPYTSMGMDLASALSADLGIPLAAYVSEVKIEDGTLMTVSQMYGGKVNVESEFSGNPKIVSVLAGAFPAEAGKVEGTPVIETMEAPNALANLRVTFKQWIEPEGGDVDITQQDVLVSIGRGIQSQENIPMVEELARKLGGALSASRPIIDNKWLPKSRQVGKSGLKVKPRLYLALGISGAPEHIEGMKDAELIIAVNSDPNAPIFEYAHYGVVGDLFDLLPILKEKLGG